MRVLASPQVDETPGTYWWHGHAGVERVDGFYGPLIVRPDGPEALVYDEERTLLISDSFHGQANAMAFGLNRCAPSDLAHVVRVSLASHLLFNPLPVSVCRKLLCHPVRILNAPGGCMV